MSISHVLLDADGVLQRVDQTAAREALAVLGERQRDVLEHFWVAEADALVGREDVVDALARTFEQHDVDVDAAALYPLVWLRTEVLPHTVDLLRRLRKAGVGVHLGTNQTGRRAAHMRADLGYDDLFDVSVYSCDVGLAKPDPAYFTRAAELIGASPADVLFVDDRPDNVDGARAAGMAAEVWVHTAGVEELHSLLAAHGHARRVTSFISHTTIDCRDAYALSEWWKPVLGYVDLDGDPNEPGHEECLIRDPATGHRLLFIEVPVPDGGLPGKRIHFDLVPRTGTRDEEVARLLALGATLVADLRGQHGPGTGWVVLADPEGNQLCVLRSETERTVATPTPVSG